MSELITVVSVITSLVLCLGAIFLTIALLRK